jgi:outer membrane protein TolC
VAGVNVTFPFMEFASIHAREAAQAATLRSAKASEILTDKTLHEQFAQAQASLRATQTIAQNTPIQRGAAQTTLNQATARYKAGLVPIDDVAQAQRLLVQAQIDDAIARLNVWRSYLHVEFIRGDIQPFLQEANR